MIYASRRLSKAIGKLLRWSGRRPSATLVPFPFVVVGIGILLAFHGPSPAVAETVEADIATLKGRTAPEAKRLAWDRLTDQSSLALIAILDAFPEDDVIAANWLRTAFEHIADRRHADLPCETLEKIAEDTARAGRVRRLALVALERVRPGYTTAFLQKRLSDPEFEWEAVGLRLALAESEENRGETERAKEILRETLAEATSYDQAKALAEKLAEAGEPPDILRHLGIVSSWAVIGPFDATPAEGLSNAYPPEHQVDLNAFHASKGGHLAWKACRVVGNDGRTDLRQYGIEPEQGAVAYAVAYFRVPQETRLVLLVSAVDNVKVWLDGHPVLEPPGSLARRNFRVDAHRAEVRLRQGVSQLLVKFVKSPDTGERQAAAQRMGVQVRPSHPADRWDFMVRFVDFRRRGVSFSPAFPEPFSELFEE